MWRNYLTVGLRALAKHRTYAAINIVGLALGIAACLVILTFVRYETSYDAWLPDAEDTYQLQTVFLPTPQGQQAQESQQTAWVAGQAFAKDFPQVERAVFLSSEGATVLRDGVPVAAERAFVTDGPLFQVLRVPFVRGDATHALDTPHSVALSEKEARAQFGPRDPIGQTLTVTANGITDTYRVTGVFRDLPRNSHLAMTMVLRIDPPTFYRTTPGVITSWTWQTGAIYVRLKPGTDPRAIEAQLPAWEKRNIPDDLGTTPATNPGTYENWKLVNVRGVHLSKAQGQGRPQGDRQTIVTFSIVALLIVGMACMNFTNLATARASQRAREVALRKVLGASRRQLVVQFLSESLLVAGIAMLIALALSELALPSLNAFLSADMRLTYLGAHGVLLPVILLTILVGLCGGLYPALYLSRFEPARILKANKSASDAEGSGRLRTILVVTQFAVSIGLIACTAVIYAQTAFARNADAGYHRQGLLQLGSIGDEQVERLMPTFLEQVRRQPGIVDAGRTNQGIAPGNNSTTDVNRPGQTPVTLGIYGVDDHIFAHAGCAAARRPQLLASDPHRRFDHADSARPDGRARVRGARDQPRPVATGGGPARLVRSARGDRPDGAAHHGQPRAGTDHRHDRRRGRRRALSQRARSDPADPLLLSDRRLQPSAGADRRRSGGRPAEGRDGVEENDAAGPVRRALRRRYRL